MLREIFIIFGTTGEYSDRSEWTVASYTDEDIAKGHVDAVEAEALAKGLKYDNEKHCMAAERDNVKLDLDPSIGHVDYTGVSYYYEKVMLYEDIQDFQNDQMATALERFKNGE